MKISVNNIALLKKLAEEVMDRASRTNIPIEPSIGHYLDGLKAITVGQTLMQKTQSSRTK